MKLKYYMQGLGTGILFSVIVLGIANSAKNSKMSDAEIIRAAKDLGMVENRQVNLTGLSPTPIPSVTIEPSIEVTVTPSPTSSVTITPSPLPTHSQTLQATETPSPQITDLPSPTPTLDSNPENPLNDSEDEMITLVILRGMSSESVAEEAYRVGLIDDVESFDRYLVEQGLASKIIVNKYEFKKGSSMLEIVERITRIQ